MRRVETRKANGATIRFGRSYDSPRAAPCFSCCGLPLAAQEPTPRFEVASIKLNTSTEAGINNRFSPGRFSYVNTPLSVLIAIAYERRLDMIVGMPEWANREKFDITATYNPEIRQQAIRMQMLQGLLAERFGLRTRGELREMPVYELVLARADGALGPQLRPSTIDCSKPTPENEGLCGTRITLSLIRSRSMLIGMLVDQLPSMVGRTVIDKTGLTGQLDLTLEWTPDTGTAAAPAAGSVTIFTALQEQLGLRLQSARTSLDVLVIDSVERPTPD